MITIEEVLKFNKEVFKEKIENSQGTSYDALKRMIEDYGNQCYIDGQSDALIETKSFLLVIGGLQLQVGVKNNVPVVMSFRDYNGGNLPLNGVLFKEQLPLSKKRIPLSPSIDLVGCMFKSSDGYTTMCVNVNKELVSLHDGSSISYEELMNFCYTYSNQTANHVWIPCYQEIEE